MSEREIQEALAEPFKAEEIEWKPQVVSKDGTKAMAVAYIGARAVMDRLDEVLGVGGWQDSYEPMPDGTVICTLRVRIGNDWVQRQNVGVPSQQPSQGDQRKSAFSSALKLTAVKLGIGRYLYRLPKTWVAYDSQAKRFSVTPQLPAWALPKPPSFGKRVHERLRATEERLVAEKLCEPGDLVLHIHAAAEAAALPPMSQWTQSEAGLTKQWIADFESGARSARDAREASTKPDGKAPVSAQGVGELARLLASKGRSWMEARQSLGFPRIEHPEKLTVAQWQQCINLASKMPDAETVPA